jgi:isocitrate/isopropylmalate dehydrogenase
MLYLVIYQRIYTNMPKRNKLNRKYADKCDCKRMTKLEARGDYIGAEKVMRESREDEYFGERSVRSYIEPAKKTEKPVKVSDWKTESINHAFKEACKKAEKENCLCDKNALKIVVQFRQMAELNNDAWN